nr:gelsolin-like protein 2 [Lytechinus pictus]
MQKAKKFDWKDSNLALFGSDTEKQVKKESAESEPAWNGAGQAVGIQIWRIVKFKVTHWPKEEYGSFYDGDSYIILNTYKKPGEEDLEHDVHFWIGENSTQDEYGTAAYKTVELDTLLDDKPVQHREVQDNESDLFKTYFKSFTTMTGGADTGFRHVTPEEYKNRLFHVCGDKKKVEVKQLAIENARLDSNDVYILDMGLKLYIWVGNGSNKDEKFKAVQYTQGIKDKRGKATSETLDQDEIPASHEFYTFVPMPSDDGTDGTDNGEEVQDTSVPCIFQLSDASGQMEFTKVAEGQLSKSDLQTDDVFLIDGRVISDGPSKNKRMKSNDRHLFVWIGKGASVAERKNAMTYAHGYLQKTDHPFLPVTVVKEGLEHKTKAFESVFH